jgi:ribosomal protein S18 acetylase RimI-like enzyme
MALYSVGKAMPTAPVPVSIQPFDATSPLLDDAVRVYTETWGREWDPSYALFARYAGLPDFRGFVARAGGATVGMGFGHRSLPGQWWHDAVAAHVGPANPALRDAWVLVELAVRAAWQGHGIGGLLHDALLDAQPLPRALLSTEVTNDRARRMYERRGWHYLHSGFAFAAGQPRFLVMHREVAHRDEHCRD